MNKSHELPADISSCVRRALSEDIGSGDLTAQLLPVDNIATAKVISRQQAILCGTAWFDEVYKQLDEKVDIHWHSKDGDEITQDFQICILKGPVRSLLTGERSALNFLQLLSGTATSTHEFTSLLEGAETKLLDTRKTIPGLRTAQKYAVACGGGVNHRMGLYDAILIKENHIQAAGGISASIKKAKDLHRSVEIEVETLEQLQEAIDAGAERIMLDNFSLDDMRHAVKINNKRAKLEVSGGVNKDQLKQIAATGVDFISVGALTKHVEAIDFSMRVL